MTYAEESYGVGFIESLPTIVLDTFTSVHSTDRTNVHYGKLLGVTPTGTLYFDYSAEGFTGPYERQSI